jgi:CRISPR-associated endoribonuclease Cas6
MNSDQRLYAVVLKLAAIRRGAVPADHGKQALSALYSLLQLGDETLAESLHDANIRKPFTVSLLDGGKPDRDGAQHFGEGDSAEWRFTLLRDPAFEALIQRYMQNHQLPHVRIGAMQFAITDAFVSGSHPNSGYVTLEKFADRYSNPPENYAQTVRMDFLTPTAFNLGTDPSTRRRRLRTTPDPRTLFSTLRKRWVALGGADPGDGFDQWVDQTIEAEPLHLKWSSVWIEKASVRGFMGSVRFRHWGTDTSWLPFLHLLTDLTFYTGVGYQTTRGMGQVRPCNELSQEKS